jgi:heptosyltransferase-2
VKVLLIRLSSLGDVILSTAAVEALAADCPGVRVEVLTKPAFRDVFRDHPGIGRALEWEPSTGVPEMAKRIRAEGYDRIVDLHGNLRTRLLRLLVPGARWSRYRKGALRRRGAVFLRRPGLLDPAHVVDRYIAALGPLGVSARRRLPRLYPNARHRERARSLLLGAGWDGEGALVALAPGARWSTKAWPADSWVELVNRINYNFSWFPVFLGGGEEKDLCAGILAEVGGRGANLAGETSILETAALLADCSVLATNDSAPLHIADAVGTPVVALFGPTARGFGFYPLGPRDVVLEEDLPCRPCSLHGSRACSEGHHRCLQGIGAERAFDAVSKAVGGGEP